MRQDDKISYLETYSVLFYRQANYNDEINKVRWEESQPSGVDYSADKVQTSPGDSMLNKVLRIEARIEEYNKLISYTDKQMKLIVDSINRVPNGVMLRLLYLRYITMLGWDMVGQQIGFAPTYARGELHDQAIELLIPDPAVVIVRKESTKTDKTLRHSDEK